MNFSPILADGSDFTGKVLPSDPNKDEFERRVKAAELLLKERELMSKETPRDNNARTTASPRPDQPEVQRPLQAVGDTGGAIQ